MSISRKIALISAITAWCIAQYRGLPREGSGFYVALGFNFMHFLMSISELR